LIDDIDEHILKQISPRDVFYSDIVMDLNEEHPEKQ
jgi:hypothetical protein